MKVILDLCVVPVGAGVSLSEYVAACHEIIRRSDLKYELHANGTNLEGEYDTAMNVVKNCHERVHEMGAPRIHTIIKLGTRVDRDQTMSDKVDSVQEKLGGGR